MSRCQTPCISNTDIITRIQADSLIAVRLEKALGGVKDAVIDQVNRMQLGAVTIVSYYGYVQESADTADRLRARNPRYYYELYAEKLEMLYFIVEPVISRNELRFSPPSSRQ